jgi:hypothetical protein
MHVGGKQKHGALAVLFRSRPQWICMPESILLEVSREIFDSCYSRKHSFNYGPFCCAHNVLATNISHLPDTIAVFLLARTTN